MNQPLLFPEGELPRAVPAAVPAEALLPDSLKGLLESGAPWDAVQALLETLPGRVVCVPAPEKLREGQELVAAIGLEHAHQVARCVGGPNARFCVPVGHRLRVATLHAAVRRDADAGVPMAELVRVYRRSERQVWAILGKG